MCARARALRTRTGRIKRHHVGEIGRRGRVQFPPVDINPLSIRNKNVRSGLLLLSPLLLIPITVWRSVRTVCANLDAIVKTACDVRARISPSRFIIILLRSFCFIRFACCRITVRRILQGKM